MGLERGSIARVLPHIDWALASGYIHRAIKHPTRQAITRGFLLFGVCLPLSYEHGTRNWQHRYSLACRAYSGYFRRFVSLPKKLKNRRPGENSS
jgi:hypothetical protein